MIPFSRLLCLGTLYCLFTTNPLLADSLPPDPEPPKDADTAVPFVVKADRTTQFNRLVIPRSFLQDAKGADNSWYRTVIAGVAMSLAAVALTFVLMRRKSTSSKVTTSVIVFAVMTFTTWKFGKADLAPPPAETSRIRNIFNLSKADVIIEIVDEGDEVELIYGTYVRPRSPSLRGDHRSRDRNRTGNSPSPSKTGNAQPR